VGRDFLPVQTGPGAHPFSCTMGTGSFTGVKCSQGMLLTTHPLLVLRPWKSRAISLPTLWATTGPVTGLLSLYIACLLYYLSIYTYSTYENSRKVRWMVRVACMGEKNEASWKTRV